MMSLEAVLHEHAMSLYITDDPDNRQKIPVRRKHVWNDTKRALSRLGFQERIGLSVVFIGEPAIDEGGPLREFFRLLMLEIENDSSLFCGAEGNKAPMHNLIALQRNDFFNVGKAISLSLSYGGPGPHFFCETIAQHLCGEKPTNPSKDVPDFELQEKLDKVYFLTVKKCALEIKTSSSNQFVMHSICMYNVVSLAYNTH